MLEHDNDPTMPCMRGHSLAIFAKYSTIFYAKYYRILNVVCVSSAH